MNKNKEIQKNNYSELFSLFLSQVEELSNENYKQIITQSLKKLQIILDVENILMVQADPVNKSYEIFGHSLFSLSYIKDKYSSLGTSFPYFRKKAYNGELLNIPCVDEMLDEAVSEKKILKERDISSLLMVPYISSKSKMYAIICFSKKEVAWDESFILELSLFCRFITFQLEKVFSLKKLKDSETKFRIMAENTYDFEFWGYPNGRHQYISPSCKRMTGYDREEFYNKAIVFYDIIHPDDLPELKKVLEPGHSNKVIHQIEFRITKKDGEIRWIELNGQQMFDENNFYLGNRISCRDSTEKKEIQENLKKALLKISTLKEELEVENVILKDNYNLSNDFPEIITNSPVMLDILNQVKLVASTDSPVLITGETGTGKELVAQAIHNLSKRNKKLMVTINCAAIPEALIESELFGREKGAYTGAVTRQVGRFQIADNSTIFLDEIGELTLETQAKLLRVLQFGEFQMLGSTKSQKVNVRIIAATNRHLKDLVDEGLFRSDLFFRINVFPVCIPPLRDRKEDIPLLVGSFVSEFSKRMGKRIERISASSMKKLSNYNWPGNLRELRNIVEYSIILSNTKILDIKFQNREDPGNSGLTLEEVEKEHILKTLKQTNWLISGENGAAKILGLKESTLRFRMKKQGIQRE